MKADRRMTHIIIAFYVQNGARPFKSSTCDLSSGFDVAGDTEVKNTDDAISNLFQVNVTYGGFKIPQTEYNLKDDIVTVGSFTNSDKINAFTDYTVFSDNLRTQSGSLMNYSQWCTQPIFVFKSRNKPNSVGGDAFVTVNCSPAAPMITTCVVLGLYDEWFTFSYDELSRITQINKSASRPSYE